MNADTALIIQAKTGDLEQILGVFVDTINTVCAKDYSPIQRAAWTAGAQNTDRWKKKLETQHFLIARLGKTIVGFASLEKNHIDFLYVHRNFQGIGIATKLLMALEDEARQNKMQQLTSDVSISAQLFFEKMGFTVIVKQNNPIRGVNLTNYRMQKMLT
jgi:putative acetyltransferase